MGINPDHKGYCTPMSKPTCTPSRKALAKRLKPGGDLYKGKTMKKKQQGGPLKQLNDMQYARRGKAVGSLLEGGKIKYASGGPGPVSKGKEEFDKIQQYAQNYNVYNQMSPHGLEKHFKKSHGYDFKKVGDLGRFGCKLNKKKCVGKNKPEEKRKRTDLRDAYDQLVKVGKKI